MCGDLLCMFECTAILQVGRDASSTKCMTTSGVGQGGAGSPGV
jgi:hypothetical protein